MFVQNAKVRAENSNFGKIKKQNGKFEHQSSLLSEICSVCRKITISCSDYFFNQRHCWVLVSVLVVKLIDSCWHRMAVANSSCADVTLSCSAGDVVNTTDQAAAGVGEL